MMLTLPSPSVAARPAALRGPRDPRRATARASAVLPASARVRATTPPRAARAHPPASSARRASRLAAPLATTTLRGASLVPSAVAEPPSAKTAEDEDAPTPASAPSPSPSDASDFDWRAQWYPVAFTADLEPDAPMTFTLLGEPLVLWRDPTAGVDEAGAPAYRCTADKCPHRLVPLSEGRVNERGEIECGYHGWTFDGTSGRCTSIPQLPSEGTALDTALASPRSCVTPYPTKVAQGMLWVLPVPTSEMAEEDRPPLPLVPEIDDPECVVQDISRDLPMDYATLLENVMDVSHVPFTHHGSVGKRENATPVVLEMEGELRSRGFEGVWREGPRNGKYGSQHTEFVAPSLMRHTLRTEQFTTLTVVYAVPTTPGRCRLMARFPFIFKAALPRVVFKLVPRWWSHLNQNAILEDDQIFLHKQERLIEIERDVGKKSYAQACYMPTKADTYVGAFRRWLAEMAGGHPAWPEGTPTALPPRETSKEALLDRFHAHTKHCASCAVAMSNITKIRKALRVLSIALIAAAAGAFARAAPNYAAVALAVGAAVVAGVREWLGGLVGKMREGPYPPPRRPPSMMEAALESARIALI